MTKQKKSSRNPWLFIPTQYFAEGMPFVIVNQLSVALFKSLQASNVFIGFTSFLYIPWSIKFLWSPYLEARSTKRSWVLATQLILAALFGLMSLSINLPSFLTVSLVLFSVMAFVSATHDIATDGFYLFALDKKDQALFTGIRSTFYRFSMIFAGGLLVTLAGSFSTLKFGWSVAFMLSAGLFLLFYLYHRFILPYPAEDVPWEEVVSSQLSVVSEEESKNGEKTFRDTSAGSVSGTANIEHRTSNIEKRASNIERRAIPFKEVFHEYFSQKKLGVIISFILLYRFGEGMLLKMAQPFLMDKPELGGMGISLSEVGIIYGTFGIAALVIGGILGGWLIKKYGLRRLIWPLAVAIHLPNILYVYLAAVQPQFIWQWDFSWLAQLFSSGSSWLMRVHPLVQSCILVEQFGYGLGFSSFTVYLLFISKGKFKTSFYAISTGIMAIGMMIPGFLSGLVQVQFGYLGLFVISTILCLPGMFTLFFLPFEEAE